MTREEGYVLSCYRYIELNPVRASMFGLSALVEGRLPEAVQIFEAALRRAESAFGRNSAAVLPVGYLAALYLEDTDRRRLNKT